VTSLRPSLDGIRVLELGSSIAGPTAGRILADLGATVIKVEPPEGDGMRTWGQAAPGGATSWWFKAHNRNKQFVCLDLHDPEQRRTVRALALTCDVLLENFRPGRMAAWGLGYDDLRTENAGLIYTAISGYGQDGPYRERAGFGNIAEAMGGLRFITGYPDRPPLRIGISLADELAAHYAVIGILAALHARERDGVGDFVDVALLEACVDNLESALPEYDALGLIRERRGNELEGIAPSNTYPTKDGRWLAIGANADGIFRRFVAVIGRPELADDPRFCGNRERAQNAAAIDAIIGEWTRTLDADVATRLLAEAHVPAGPVNSIADIVGDEQVRARGLVAHVEDEHGNRVGTFTPVPRLHNHRSVLSHAARDVGADTERILADLRAGEPRAGS
jgi:formyl-CoA transferase